MGNYQSNIEPLNDLCPISLKIDKFYLIKMRNIFMTLYQFKVLL